MLRDDDEGFEFIPERTHEGVTCDGCGKSNFVGIRHKCNICYDYDLCDECFVNGITSKSHVGSHPMKNIALQPGDSYGFFFGIYLVLYIHFLCCRYFFTIEF